MGQIVIMILWIGGVLVGLWLLCEVILRLASISYPSFYEIDEHMAIALHPKAEGWWNKENKVYVQINSHGLRDRERSYEKPPHTLRIALLGNSFCEALQVPLEKTLGYEIERLLNQCPEVREKEVEVINFGVANYSTTEELLTLRHRAWKYSPDIVVLTLLTVTDVLGNSFALKQNPSKPYFVKQNGQLVLNDSFRQSRIFRAKQTLPARFNYWLLDHSRLFQVVYEAKNRMRARYRGNPDELPDNARDVYREPTDPAWQEAWDVTERLITLMRDEVHAKSVKFLLVVLNNPIQVNPDPAVRQRYMKRIGVETLFYPDQRLKAFAEREGIPVLALAPELQQYAERNQLFLHGFGEAVDGGSGNDFSKSLGRGHWNENGHRIVGEMIARKICTEILPL